MKNVKCLFIGIVATLMFVPAVLAQETNGQKEKSQGKNRQGVLIIGKITPNLETQQCTIKEVEKGFPITFTSDEKSYTIDKCKIIHSESIIYIEIFGEGVGQEWVNEQGDLAVLCTYYFKGTEYTLPVIGVDQTSVAYTAIAVGRKLFYPDALMFYPSNNGKVSFRKGIKIKVEKPN